MTPPWVPKYSPISLLSACKLALAAVVSFHLAYAFGFCSWCMAVFLYCIFRLAWLETPRLAIYFGLGIGLAVYAPHLLFFWTLFGPASMALWCVLSVWLALFLVIGRASLSRWGVGFWALAAPFVWTGLEYFRSEVYYLKFSWLSPGYAFSNSFGLSFLAAFGTYGIGFLLMSWAAYVFVFKSLSKTARRNYGVALLAISSFPFWLPATENTDQPPITITGIQLEGSNPGQVKSALNAALKQHPETDLFVLSEYAFQGPVPPEILAWCKAHGKWLAAGGEDPISPKKYYNTVFVVGTNGSVVFKQGKCVPVQFLKDGLPASEQHVWDSPWGKLGFGICYDASYTRVTDELVSQGAQALIFPTMDNGDWGRAEHTLHSRIAPMRAAEYGLPVFRLCSSGISQFVDRNGHVVASAPFPGQAAMLSAKVDWYPHGKVPPDRPLAQLAVVLAVALILFLWIEAKWATPPPPPLD